MSDTLEKIENEILDKEFLKYDISYWNHNIAIGHLLKNYGNIVRSLINDAPIDTVSEELANSVLLLILKGLGRCCKWILSQDGDVIPKPSFEEKDKEAFKFLMWGQDYEVLASLHTAYWKNVIHCKTDFESKTIEFKLNGGQGTLEFLMYQHQIHGEIIKSNSLLNKLRLQKTRLYNQIIEKKSIEDHYDNFDWEIVGNSKLFDLERNYYKLNILPEIDEFFDVVNYTINDYKIFFSILKINCEFISYIEDQLDLKYGEENRFGSIVIVLSKNDFINFMHKISKLEKYKVRKILEDILLNTAHFHTGLEVSPIIISNDEIYFSSRLVSAIDPERILVNILTKVKAQYKIYDKLITLIEKVQIQKITKELKKVEALVFV